LVKKYKVLNPMPLTKLEWLKSVVNNN